eukprot:3443891-Pyramimonas_sp.AAC.1
MGGREVRYNRKLHGVPMVLDGDLDKVDPELLLQLLTGTIRTPCSFRLYLTSRPPMWTTPSRIATSPGPLSG